MQVTRFEFGGDSDDPVVHPHPGTYVVTDVLGGKEVGSSFIVGTTYSTVSGPGSVQQVFDTHLTAVDSFGNFQNTNQLLSTAYSFRADTIVDSAAGFLIAGVYRDSGNSANGALVAEFGDDSALAWQSSSLSFGLQLAGRPVFVSRSADAQIYVGVSRYTQDDLRAGVFKVGAAGATDCIEELSP